MKDYASRQRSPRKHLVGLGAVVVLHALLFWAINSGLAHKFVKIVKGPVEAVLLEETKPDIPPPPPPPPPPKNLPPPPPAYVPPVEVQVNAPPPVNAIAAVSNKPQPEAPPSPAPVVTAPPAPIARTAAVISAASCEKPYYPIASRLLEEEGTVTLKFLVGVDGKVKESAVEKSSGYKRLDEAARQGLSKCQFKPGTENGHPVEGWENMKYTWKLE